MKKLLILIFTLLFAVGIYAMDKNCNKLYNKTINVNIELMTQSNNQLAFTDINKMFKINPDCNFTTASIKNYLDMQKQIKYEIMNDDNIYSGTIISPCNIVLQLDLPYYIYKNESFNKVSSIIKFKEMKNDQAIIHIHNILTKRIDDSNTYSV
ncbi:MAG TPA: hypothetical protein QF753_20930 [Victivallales bacterium]|nr:hypothetical protein [Victivallales bacterium]